MSKGRSSTNFGGSMENGGELELEFYFYLNTVNQSDKIIIIKITIYFTIYKHDLKISIVKIEKILLYIDAVCILSIQTKKSRQPFRKD